MFVKTFFHFSSVFFKPDSGVFNKTRANWPVRQNRDMGDTKGIVIQTVDGNGVEVSPEPFDIRKFWTCANGKSDIGLSRRIAALSSLQAGL